MHRSLHPSQTALLSAPPVLAHARQAVGRSPPLYGHGASMQRHEIGRALAQSYLPIGLLIFRAGALRCSFQIPTGTPTSRQIRSLSATNSRLAYKPRPRSSAMAAARMDRVTTGSSRSTPTAARYTPPSLRGSRVNFAGRGKDTRARNASPGFAFLSAHPHPRCWRNAGRRSTGLSFNVKTFAVGAAAKGVGDAVGGARS